MAGPTSSPPDEPEKKDDGNEPVIQPRRRVAPAREAALEAERVDELADIADTVKELSERLDQTLNGPAPAAAEPEPRVSRRWQKKARPDAHFRDATPAATPGSNLKRPQARRTAKRRGTPIGALIGAQVFGFGMIAFGYFLGHLGTKPAEETAEPPAAADSPTGALNFSRIERGVSEKAFESVDGAMSAAKQGNSAEARTTLENAQRENLGVPGIDYRLALLALGRGDLKEAKLRLDCAMAANQEMAGCCYVRAMLAGSIGDYNRASQEFSKAVYAEPFNARYLFFWAECLRRDGKLQAAIDRFQEALTRPLSPTDAEYVSYKLRLAKIEAGQAQEFAAELADKLKVEPPSASWLFTAAAEELENKQPVAAAAHLQRATQMMPPADFDSQIRDYLFVGHAEEKEIAPYFQRGAAPVSPSPNVAAITVDPLSWTLPVADPGSWPTAPADHRTMPN